MVRKRNKRWIRLLYFGMVLGVIVTSCNFPSPSPIPPPTSTAPNTRAPAPSLTPIPSLSPSPTSPSPSPSASPSPSPAPSVSPTSVPSPTSPSALVPDFSHVIVIVLENREYGAVVAHSDMPAFNRLAQEYTLLTQYYAVRHPSLPNYIAMISGDVQGIGSDCRDCFVNAPNLADQLDAHGYSWRTYQEDMPSPCFAGNSEEYVQKHNPFVYFDSIRLNKPLCEQNVVPLSDLQNDLDSGNLPNFVFITPNLCNSGHDCDVSTVDAWLSTWTERIMQSPGWDKNSLLVITWDEGQGNHSCCGMGEEAGGRVATALISDLAQKGFEDDTPYSHYSLLKTIEEAWGLEKLGHAADKGTSLIVAPWTK